MEDLHLHTIDHKKLFSISLLCCDSACKLLVHTVVLQLVHHILQVHERVVDSCHCNLWIGHGGTEHEAADPAKTIDTHTWHHRRLEGPRTGYGCRLNLGNDLACNPSTGLEVCPRFVVRGCFVVRRGGIIDISLIEHKFVRIIPVAQEVETQAPWVGTLVARHRDIVFHSFQKILHTVWLYLHSHKYRFACWLVAASIGLECPTWER
mmetsp:Transcript_57074/g.144884  ORF Transcript_57074/g.144884 Transcript_57074/m.144884 type:complete len:207 (+) Transcript_57074:310-930(+)